MLKVLLAVIVATLACAPGALALTPQDLRDRFEGDVSRDHGPRHGRSLDCGEAAVVFTPKTPQVRRATHAHMLIPCALLTFPLALSPVPPLCRFLVLPTLCASKL